MVFLGQRYIVAKKYLCKNYIFGRKHFEIHQE